jgi:phosphopantetheinyl transferase
MTSRGLSSKLECLPARGALLDAATQAAGFWFILHATKDRQLLPYRIDRIRFFGPDPEPGTWHDCTVHVIEMTDVWARSNVEISSNNRVWAKIEGLEDRRFESDDRFYRMWRKSGTLLGADVDADGISTVLETWRTAASRYFIARGYLDSEEQAEYHRRKGIAQRAWLLGRVAAKDVARAMLMDKGMKNIYPIQIRIDNDASGRPIIQGPWEADYRISLAHKETMAVAIIAEGEDIGIDLEQISHHDEAFVGTAFLEEEMALLPPRDRDEWLTRLWVAKEAYAKARGQGISNPRAIRAVNREAKHFFIGDTWVTTRREGDFIIGWTESANIWRPGRRGPGD